MIAPRPLRIAVPDETLDRTRTRRAACEWHEMPDDAGWGWAWVCGARRGYMKALCACWIEGFDGRMQPAALDRFARLTPPVEGIEFHFIVRERGPVPCRFRR